MQLTRANHEMSPRLLVPFASSRGWVVLFVAVTYVGIFVLDRSTGRAPVQHLYYLPIILTALSFGYRGGLTAAFAAIVLYHLANGALLTRRYEESDIIQISLFLLVGVGTAKLVSDAQRLRRLAMTDDLTGLHNLRSFESQLARLVSATRRANEPLSLLVLDVDRLKELNDRHGHLAGAEAVRTVGQIIAGQLPQDSVACRYGGDEFVIAVPARSAAVTEQLARGLCEVVHATSPLLLGRRWPAGTLSISIGVASRTFDEAGSTMSCASDAQEGEGLFLAADHALYLAKGNGRNRVELYKTLAAPTGTQPAKRPDSLHEQTKADESGMSMAAYRKPSIK